jgi:hypothetical protein
MGSQTNGNRAAATSAVRDVVINGSSESRVFSNRTDRILILLLCSAAAFRVFIFSAAFPFFSNVDETLHFDLITQYSHGHIPRTFGRLTAETLDWIVPYASPEFLVAPDQFPEEKYPPPLWKQIEPEVEPEIAATKTAWSGEVNFESSQPPLYYVATSVWWSLGKHIGLRGIQALYWIRFVNVLLIALVVWLGYVTARMIAPERVELRLGVPLLLAMIPQNVFYAINNDVLSPFCFGVLFLFVLQWLRAETTSLRLGAVTGLAVAAAYLTKLSNAPLIAVALVTILAKLLLMVRRNPRAGVVALVAMIFCAAIPIGIWLVWTKFHFGDATGSTEKITLLGWTRKPLADWWRHPIFTPYGVWVFCSSLMTSFWRGELTWHGQLLTWGPADGFFVISSLLFLACSVVGVLKPAALSSFQRQAIGVAISICVAGILFLALLSVQFDFGDSTGPSRAHPYFTAGRLLTGALIPFAVCYVCGLTVLLRPAKSAVLPLAIIAGLAVFVTVSEISTNRVVFASEHNWFHR